MNWFEQITGFPEGEYAVTRDRLRVENGRLISEEAGVSHAVGDLEFLTLNELRERAQNIRVPGKLNLNLLEGDVRRLHCDSENAGAVFQVASQFNLLEMVGPNVTPEHGVSRYEFDLTQGPACAIAAGAGTIWRNYLVPVGDQIGQTAQTQLDGLSDLGAALATDMGVDGGPLWEMRNGYALPERQMLSKIDTHLSNLTDAERDMLRGLLRVGVHKGVGVTEKGASPDTRVTQVYCAALPVAYSGIPSKDWESFATLILEAAYEATMLAAVLNAAAGTSNRLLLTRIGGGAFGNDDAWINTAILRALRIVSGQGLQVVMVSYGSPNSAMRSLEAAWQNEF